MDIKNVTERVGEYLKKYKFVVLVLLIGLVLMLIPGYNEVQKEPESNLAVTPADDVSFEEKLAVILGQIDGAGRVEVMLTTLEGEEIIFQTDEVISNNAETSSQNIDTVTVTDANKNQNGLIRKVNPPIYRGAIIVCQGADDPTVKLAITEAVAKITGMGTNCISVLKMK